MKAILSTLGIAVSLVMLSTTALAKGDPGNGQKLFAKSQCQRCHSTDIFTKDDRKVNSLPELEGKVRVCDSQLSVNWFDDEIDDVVAYLNRDFYKFGQGKTQSDGK